MYLSEISTDGFRNLNPCRIELSSDLNIIYGNNAAGKSSILEAINYLVSGRSFRTAKQNHLVTHNLDYFTLFGRFSDSSKIGVTYNNVDKTRRIKLNNELVRSLSSIASLYPAQTLSPESYHLIDSGPNQRRKYLDWLLFHVEHSYQNIWSDFYKALKLRNAFLKQSHSYVDINELEVWNKPFEQAADKVTKLRSRIAKVILAKVIDILTRLQFSEAEQLRISYYSGYTGDLNSRLGESVAKDRLLGTTQYGPHKGDLRLKIGKHLAKDVLSRGQKKLLINGLYLAQTEILKENTQKDSLFMIDDFSSELDEGNQSALIRSLQEQNNVQIILSCLNADVLKHLIKGYNNVRMFHVEHGNIKVDENN